MTDAYLPVADDWFPTAGCHRLLMRTRCKPPDRQVFRSVFIDASDFKVNV